MSMLKCNTNLALGVVKTLQYDISATYEAAGVGATSLKPFP